MSEARIGELEARIHQEEKRFLMERYVSLLLVQFESPDEDGEGEPLDERTVESLLVARPHVSGLLAEQIEELLTGQGHEVEELEAEGDSPGPGGGADAPGDSQEPEYGGLFDDDAEEDELVGDAGNGDVGESLFEDEDDGEVDELVGDTGNGDEGESLFEDEDVGEADGLVGDTDSGDEGESLFEDEDVGEADELVGDTGSGDEGESLFEDEDVGEADGLLGDVEELEDDTGNEDEGESLFEDEVAEGDSANDSEEADDVGLFDNETEEGEVADDSTEETPEAEADGEPTEEDEDAGVLFGSDIYSGNEGTGRPGEEGEDGEAVETPGFEPGEGNETEETAGFTPTEGHDVEETPGFEPTEGHETEETAGFTPTKGHDVEETPGFEPTEGHETEETAGFTPTEGHDVEETPGFTPTKGHEVKETPGFTPKEGAAAEAPAGKQRKKGKKEGPEGVTPDADAEAKRLQARKERQEKLKQAQEARRARIKKAQQPAAEEQAEEEGEEELELDSLTHQISLDDLEQYLDISIIPDDRSRLERRWEQKMRDPSIRHLIADKGAMNHGYALIPRLPRYFRGGQTVPTNLVSLLRSFPQLFDNVAQVISKYRTEPFFVREAPELDWAIVAVEVLPESRGRNYMEQKTVIKQYAQRHQANERRIQRRRLIDALYDCIVVKAITKEEILTKTVDLTETKVGRQNFACVNFGDKGIRVNDVGRTQGHQQMGISPSW